MPLVSVLVLLACRAIDSVVLRHGIVGANGVEPLSIMALFISLVCSTSSSFVGRPLTILRRIYPYLWTSLVCFDIRHFG